MISAYLKDVPLPVLAACCEDYKSLGLWNTRPVMQREGLERLRDSMLAAGYIKTRLTFEQCVDMRFAEQVVREDPPSI